ncbi:MAG: DNA repair protein RecO [Planctomycetes bacterium]|nr:DNA repair protein RecO [Planctomycetota bacterium]
MSDSTQQVEVLVLSVQNWSNSSQIVRMLSEVHGAQSMIARGSRRMSPDFRYGPLDVLQWGSARLEQRTKGFQLTGFDALSSFPALCAHNDRLLAAFHVIEILLDGTCAAPQPGLLRLALETLAAFEHGELAALESVLLRFELRFLMLAGRAPLLDRCVRCSKVAPEMKAARLDPLRGGLVCRACLRGGEARMVALSVATRTALRELGACDDPRNSQCILANERVRAVLQPLLRLLTGLALERPLPELAFAR